MNEVGWPGKHLLIDMHGVAFDLCNDIEAIDAALTFAAVRAGATILHSYFHPFDPNGVTGVICLAESHISIHTWPDKGFVALDIFMCGKCDPLDALEYILAEFRPNYHLTSIRLRPDNNQNK